jgi:hypothetical protein
MRDIWHGDKRDLVKWSGIVYLCQLKQITNVLHVVYYRKERSWPKIDFDGSETPLPDNVIKHFRDVDDISRLADNCGLVVRLVKREFNGRNRNQYNGELINNIKSISKNKKKIVFLDPDTGLAPKTGTRKHVMPEEVKKIWNHLNNDDVLVFYQHSFHIRDREWITVRRKEMAKCCSVGKEQVKMWLSQHAHDVVFFFIEKTSI